jgi:hypothetical protein
MEISSHTNDPTIKYCVVTQLKEGDPNYGKTAYGNGIVKVNVFDTRCEAFQNLRDELAKCVDIGLVEYRDDAWCYRQYREHVWIMTNGGTKEPCDNCTCEVSGLVETYHQYKAKRLPNGIGYYHRAFGTWVCAWGDDNFATTDLRTFYTKAKCVTTDTEHQDEDDPTDAILTHTHSLIINGYPITV